MPCFVFLLLSSDSDVSESSLLLAFLPCLYFFFFPPLSKFDDSKLSPELVLDEDSLSSALISYVSFYFPFSKLLLSALQKIL